MHVGTCGVHVLRCACGVHVLCCACGVHVLCCACGVHYVCNRCTNKFIMVNKLDLRTAVLSSYNAAKSMTDG